MEKPRLFDGLDRTELETRRLQRLIELTLSRYPRTTCQTVQGDRTLRDRVVDFVRKTITGNPFQIITDFRSSWVSKLYFRHLTTND